jgi:hypothetical protein
MTIACENLYKFSCSLAAKRSRAIKASNEGQAETNRNEMERRERSPRHHAELRRCSRISGSLASSQALSLKFSKRCLMGTRREMKADQPNFRGNVVPFRTRSGSGRDPVDHARSGNILRMLDLSKFEHHRPAVENRPSMRSNIAAMVLLGLLVFIATEDFSRLEQSNLCFDKSECRN